MCVADVPSNPLKPLGTVCRTSQGTEFLCTNSGECGGCNAKPPVTYPTGDSTNSVAAADLTGDGQPDLAVGRGNANVAVSILVNKGNDVFADPIDYDAKERLALAGGASAAMKCGLTSNVRLGRPLRFVGARVARSTPDSTSVSSIGLSLSIVCTRPHTRR